MTKRIFLWVLISSFAVALANAQSTVASLTGSVLDPGGLPVEGAKVTAENPKTGVQTTTESNASGVFSFPSLLPGEYTVSAEHEGFRRLVVQNVRLEVGGRVNLNLQLEIGTLAQSVEVKAEMENAVGYNTTSVGGMVTGQKVLDLPLIGRDALGLVATQAGLVSNNFAGQRRVSMNITLDGVNIQDNRINTGISSSVFASTDRVAEFRVISSPVDAELGRGAGQIQMITRSGDNRFHGSLFEFHRNTVLNANTWFNNQRGLDASGAELSPRNFLIRNQYGGRVGGPIKRNKSFFHVNYEEEKIRTITSTTPITFTATARQGIFRFFPGVQNGNAASATPTVDLNGSPVKPSNATGELQTVNLLGRDPNRSVADPAGLVQKGIGLMPLPNDFRAGDGLNTGGYTWRRGESDDSRRLAVRLDHNFTDHHRLGYVYTYETENNPNGFLAQPFPQSPGGDFIDDSRLHSLTLTSILRPNLLNEFRAGIQRHLLRFRAPWEITGNQGLGVVSGRPFLLDFIATTSPNGVTDPVDTSNDPQGRISPVYEYADTVSWLRGRHQFKGGAAVRFVSTNGFNSFDVMPRAVFGAGGPTVQNISTIPGIGQNLTGAQNLLHQLTGSLANARQAFNSPGGQNPVFLAGEGKQRTWRSRELSFFFKDDWKFRPNLTLFLGLRYDWYGVPYDANGKAVGLAGGTAGVFGLSGTTWADLYQPGRLAGSLTQVELVGKNSPNSSRKLYNNDNNNLAPSVGFSWSPQPKDGWMRKLLGDGRTVLRAGYGVFYDRTTSLRLLDVVAGDQPGLRSVRTFTTANYLDLSLLTLPLAPLDKPLASVPLTDRTQTVRTYDTGLRSEYFQDWNISLQRALSKTTTLEVRYVGTKGTRLLRGTTVNDGNIFENGILDAFRTTQAGGNSALLDRIFMGLTVAGLSGPVNGTTVRGSDLVRANTTTQAFLSAHDVGGFAAYLSNSSQFTNENGGLLRRGGLPENFVNANPQFASARLFSNFGNSTYHSLQVEVIRRAGAATVQANYTWSKALGDEEGDGQEQNDSFRTLRNWSFDKRLMSFHRTHVVRSNVIWELPIGPGKRLLGGTHGVVGRLIEKWQLGAIYNIFSGQPISLTSLLNTYNNLGDDNTPTAMGNFSKGTGHAQTTGNSVVYFQGLTQVADPSIAGMTTANGIRGRSTLSAIADSNGRIVLVNPTPGTLGTLAPRFIEGPGSFRLDMNVVKRIMVREGMDFEIRADATNVFNSPVWSNPIAANLNINSVDFGRITSVVGNSQRIMQVGLRFSF